MIDLDTLERRQAERIEYARLLAALIDREQVKIDNLRANQRFGHTVHRFALIHG